MVDVLARCKEMAVGQPDPHLFTVATLTGHAVLGKVMTLNYVL